jgi:hypothetical protein
LYRIAQNVMSAMATVWNPPSTITTAAWIAMARTVVRRDGSSYASDASREAALTKWEICGT